MKIYTKTGDDGETGLFGAPRVSKDDVRIEAYGTVDELNAWLGLVRSESPPSELEGILERVQNDLFAVGAELATPDAAGKGMQLLTDARVTDLEETIDFWDAHLAQLREFILPGGTRCASSLHVARAVCRRAERRVVTLSKKEQGAVSTRLLIYINRLSDLLFVLARAANSTAGQPDVAWKK